MNAGKLSGLILPLLLWGCLGIIASAHAQTPSIVVPPASQSSAVGGTIQFTVSATGGGTLAYQWRKNGTNLVNGVVSGAATISGATTTVVTLTTITTNDQANYTCRITNSSGSITSSIASLTVVVSPTITTQPKSANTNVGSTVAFIVVASGTVPFTYQWYKDSSPISGATLNAYSISGVFISDSGTYNVRVSNAAGTITSSNAVLNVGIVPAITSQPSSLIVTQGQSASFSVTATGTPLNYYWKKNGTFISGQTNSSLAFASTVPTNAAAYTCQVSNFLGNVISAGAGLTVYYPPTITIQPVGKTVGVGSNFTVSVTASGVPTVAYQWRTNGAAITGATASSYTVTAAQTNHAGSYDVVITNSLGSLTSSVANVSIVYYPPTISQQPIGGNIAVGNSFILFASATGTAPISWKWFKDGLAISNAVTVTTNLTGPATFAYTNNSAQIVDSGNYQVVLENSSGSATSSVAVVNVGYAPVVVQQPISATNILGGSNTFSCVVTGTVPINVQWMLNDIPLPGATNATLILTNLQPVTIGYYALTATNAFGGTVSSNASLNLTGYDYGVWNGLVAYYPFNGNANDASGHGNDGTNFGAVLISDRFANTNNAYAFNETNWIDIGNVISPYDLMTFSAWFKTTNATVSKENGILTKLRSDGGIGARLGVYGGTVDIGFNNYAVNLTVLDSKSSSDGVWHQAVFVNNTSRISLYVDGQFTSQSAYSPNAANSLLSVVIGNDPSSGNRFFTGQIDDVRIYNRALSSNEVSSLYAMEADLPIITQQPQPQTDSAGGTVAFSVTAIANHALTYQWFKDGFALNSATNITLTLSNVQPNQIGYYSVAVSNGVAGMTSTNAALNLNGYSFSNWQGLVAYYTFTGNANDVSGFGNNGVVNGASAALDRFGLASSAYSFDGTNSYIDCGTNISLGAPAGQFTVSTWFKTSGSGVIISDYDAPGGSDSIFSVNLSIHGTAQVETETRSAGNDYDVFSTQTSLGNQWHQAVYIMDGSSSLLVYIDGRLDHATAYLAASDYSSNPHWRIGANKFAGAINDYFSGSIDDVRLYNRALSSNEVTSLYSMESDVPVITQQPQAQTANAGSMVTFNVTATANHPLIYQWRKNGVDVTGATNSALTFSNVQAAYVGFYSVAVSNTVTGVFSASALLNLTGFADPTWKGLVAYYPFVGNANDSSGHGLNFSSIPDLSADRFGQPAMSASFTTPNPLSTASIALNNQGLGLSLWVKLTRLPSPTADRVLMHGSWNLADGLFSIAFWQDGRGGIAFQDSNGQSHDVTASAGTFSTNRWYNLIFTGDGTNVAMFINGSFYGAISGTLATKTAPIILGGDAGYYFSAGLIDDIRIYNRALSSDEVAYLYLLESQSTLQPPQVLSTSLGAGPNLSINLTGLPGHSYILQTATNLLPPIQWLPVLTNAADTNGVWQFMDTNLNSAQKFYRVTTP